MASPDFSAANWRKSSRSGSSNGGGGSNCIEVALGHETARIRDSKNNGQHVACGLDAWETLLAHAKAGGFTR